MAQPTTYNRQPTTWIQRLFLVLLLVVSGWLLVGAERTYAQTNYKLLAPIPLTGGAPTPSTQAGPYIKGIFNLAIAIAGGLAVIMMIFGGIKYMSTDAWDGKSEGKATILNAIWGLVLAISAWLILYTINPKLVEFDLTLTSLPPPSAIGAGPGTPTPSAGCPTCEVVKVNFKLPMMSPTECGRPGGCGCAYPGPCTVDATLNNKLVALDAINKLRVNEAFPPTRPHSDPCHNNGTCVDAAGCNTSHQCIKKFIDDAKSVGLRAEYEVKTLAEAQAIRAATGLSASQVRVVENITGNNGHYSIYLN